jgi:hypothetical protein
MALQTAVLDAANDGATAIMAWAAIHSDGTSGTQTSNERIAISWGASAAAVATSGGVPLAFTGAANADASHLGVWSLQAGGTFRGAAALTGDQTFNSAGEYNVTAITLTATDQTV